MTSNFSGCTPVPGAADASLAPPGYREAFLALFIIFLLCIVASLILFIRERNRSGRLAKRSITLILVSSLSAIFSCFVVLYREYYGRSRFPCLAVLTIHYLALPLVVGPLVAKVYVHAYRLRRSQIRAGLSFAAVKKEQDRIDRGEARHGQGLVQDLSSFVTLQSKPKRGSKSLFDFGRFGLGKNHHEQEDSFEMISPAPRLEEPFSVTRDEDDVQPLKQSGWSPIKPSQTKSSHHRQESSGGDEKLTRPASLKSSPMANSTDGNGTNLVSLHGDAGSPSASPNLARQASRKSKSKTEEIVRKASRNSSTPALSAHRHLSGTTGSERHRDSRHLSKMSSTMGWWSPRAQDLESEVRLDELIKNESTIWGIVMVLLFISPFALAILVRALTDPDYQAGCTGCDFSALDVYIQCGLSVFILSIFTLSTLALWNTPDPLGIMWEAKLCVVVFFLLAAPTAVLYLTDPMDLESQYKFTWLAVETLAVFLILMIQTVGQVALTRWANRNVPRNISLFRLLENVELRDMFDDHLASEFSIENLRFWDRAIHWKISYEDMSPDEIQRRAKDLYQVFIQRDAAMALNLGANNFQKLQSAFAPGAAEPVSRNVFDDALKECFKLMNDGLARFLVSEKYRSFLHHAPPDFEGDMLRNRALGLDLNATVDQYLKQLESLQSRSSYTNGMSGSTAMSLDPSSTPRRGSRPSITSPFASATNRKTSDVVHTLLPSSKEEHEEEDAERSRPLSLKVRKSVSTSVSHPVETLPPSAFQNASVNDPPRRPSNFVQVIPSQTLSSSTSASTNAGNAPTGTLAGNVGRSSPQKAANRSSIVQVLDDPADLNQ